MQINKDVDGCNKDLGEDEYDDDPFEKLALRWVSCACH